MNTTETLQVTAPSATEIVRTRTFTAPRQLVFDAFTRPELIRRWIGRAGDEMTVCDVDLRVGGAYRYVLLLRADERGDATRFARAARFSRSPHRSGSSARSRSTTTWGETVITTVFVERDGRTTVTTTCRYESQDVRDAILALGRGERGR